VQLKPKIISPTQKPQRRSRKPFGQTPGIPAEYMVTVIKKIKTAHNPKSKCREKTMTYYKNMRKINAILLKHHRVPIAQKIEITQTGL
jgi:hypothetical protein